MNPLKIKQTAAKAKELSEDDTKPADAVIPKPATCRDRAMIEKVGEALDKPCDEVSVGDMRAVARQKLTSAREATKPDELAYGYAATEAYTARQLFLWLNRNA